MVLAQKLFLGNHHKLQFASNSSSTAPSCTAPILSQPPKNERALCGHQTVDVLPPPSPVTPIEVDLTNQKACTSTLIASEAESPGLGLILHLLQQLNVNGHLESNYKNNKLDPAYFKLSTNSSTHVHCSACNVNLSIGGSNGFSNVYAHNRRSQHSNAVKKLGQQNRSPRCNYDFPA